LTTIEETITYYIKKGKDVEEISLLLWKDFTLEQVNEFKRKWMPNKIISLEIWDSIINFKKSL